MFRPFSRRTAPKPDVYRYDLPKMVRSRIFHTLRDQMDDFYSHIRYSDLANEVLKMLLQQYGGISSSPGGYISRDPMNAVPDHFFNCSDELALDFLEFWFQVPP